MAGRSPNSMLIKFPQLTLFFYFLRLGRIKFLVYSWIAYGIGSAFSIFNGYSIDIRLYIHGLVVVWCTHLMTHYCNEFFDLEADQSNLRPTQWTGGSGVLRDGFLKPSVSLSTAFILLFVSLGFTLSLPNFISRYLCFCALIAGWFYTAPPIKFNYRGFGEITVSVTLNLLTPMLGYYLQSGKIDYLFIVILLPGFVFQYLRMTVMNLLDYDGDKIVGKKTIPILIGRKNTVLLYIFGQFFAYGLLVMSTFSYFIPSPVVWIILMTIPISLWQVKLLLSEAYLEQDLSNRIAFLASTHVALVLSGTLLGITINTYLSGTSIWKWGSINSQLIFCILPLIIFFFLLVQQVKSIKIIS